MRSGETGTLKLYITGKNVKWSGLFEKKYNFIISQHLKMSIE